MTNPAYGFGADRYMGSGHASRPARYATAITPSDAVNVAIGPAACYAKSLFIGVAGNLNIIAAGDNSNNGLGTAVLFSNVPVGWFPVMVRAVLATLTTASSIVGVAD
jgi:hypothetical protein